MTAVDADARRNFEDMSIREAQEALADELTEQGAAMAVDDGEEETPAIEPEADDRDTEETAADEAAAEEEPIAVAAPVAVWTAAEMAEHARMAEALLFAASEPLDEASIAARLPAGADVKTILLALKTQFENHGVNLSNAAGKWRFLTAPDVAHVLEITKVEQKRLSRAALETLAIIAYHQPCTRADIEDVRGVAVSKGSIDQLMEIGWVRLRGRRRDAPGRPVLYGTTPAFLEHFNLETVADLPGMADLKAAGLLDARLPPGFCVPTPSDADDDDEGDDADADAAAEFVQDFHEDASVDADEDDEGPEDVIY